MGKDEHVNPPSNAPAPAAPEQRMLGYKAQNAPDCHRQAKKQCVTQIIKHNKAQQRAQYEDNAKDLGSTYGRHDRLFNIDDLGLGLWRNYYFRLVLLILLLCLFACDQLIQ